MTTAMTGLRRLPLLDPDAPRPAGSATGEADWDRPAVDVDLVAAERGSADGAPEAERNEVDVDLVAAERAMAEPSDPERADGGPGAASSWFRPSRVVPAVAAVIVGALAVAFVGDEASGPAPGEALVTVDGRAEVTRADGDREVVTDRTRLEPGDRLDMRRGSVTFELADDVQLEGSAATSLVMDRRPELRAGELLVDAPAATTVQAGPASVAVADGGVARLSRSFAVEVDVYRGSAAVGSAGVSQDVDALHAVAVAAVGEVSSTGPLAYDDTDPWDRRYLADAVALDGQLAPLATSMRAAGVDPVALRADVAAELASPPSAGELAAAAEGRRASLDLAIGLAVVGSGDRGTFASRWQRGLAFRDDGATWGLVATDLGAAPEDVTAALRAALDLGTDVLGAGLDRDADAEAAGGEDGAGTTASTTTPDGGEAGGAAGGAEDPSAVGGGTDGAVEGGGSNPGGSPAPTTPGGGPASPTPTVPGPATPPATTPPVTLPPVTLPPVTLPGPTIPVVTPLVEVVGGVVGAVTEPLGPILGPGGLLPILPGGKGGLLGP